MLAVGVAAAIIVADAIVGGFQRTGRIRRADQARRRWCDQCRAGEPLAQGTLFFAIRSTSAHRQGGQMQQQPRVTSGTVPHVILMLIGDAAACALARDLGYPWFALTLAITGRIAPVFKPPRVKVMTSAPRQWAVLACVVVFSVLAIGATIRGGHEWQIWVAVPACIVAWLEFTLWRIKVGDAQKVRGY